MGTKRVGWARIRSLINENQNQLKRRNREVISAAAAKTLTAADSGAVIYWTQADAHDITLPTAAAGLNYTFFIVAGSAHIHYILTQTDDVVYGKATVLSTTNDQSELQSVAKASGKDKIFIKSDGATTGGGTGDVVRVFCDVAGYWFVNADLHTTNANPASVVTFQD